MSHCRTSPDAANAPATRDASGAMQKAANATSAVPMSTVRLDRQPQSVIMRARPSPVNVASQAENRGEPRGHLLDARGGLRVIERHRLEAVDSRNVPRAWHARVQRNLHGVGVGELALDLW
jgi:hypothetical protein